MNEKKHALLIFSKAPIPGLTKTRLTIARGGILSEEQAAEFYQASLLDVLNLSFYALNVLNKKSGSGEGAGLDRYELVISNSPASEQPVLERVIEENGPWPGPIHFINDRGQNFDQHFDDAFNQLFALGYHNVVAIGGDMPTMPTSHLVKAFEWLEHFDKTSPVGGFVQAPCQACGVSLVGYSHHTPMDSEGVYYSLDGVPALDAYTMKSIERDVPIALLDAVADIDDVEDLAHSISIIRTMAVCHDNQPELVVPDRVIDFVRDHGIAITTPPNDLHDPRERIDA
ncbi:hypothetical protein SAMN05660420_01770 [Desulfuromusa kysingii]|uniref:DUF2064 domain-containing protein n=1 Tax=Desulfuromusa kysingii TaxID=37625 RepID=A0A1H4A221_9BACT|nr:DUF2064 domain-containing protein [Desulfuromusa kysingii]SEA30035.1 hypothetical protein SAMN05660420_01770 [Desulfuromusa kysingii]